MISVVSNVTLTPDANRQPVPVRTRILFSPSELTAQGGAEYSTTPLPSVRPHLALTGPSPSSVCVTRPGAAPFTDSRALKTFTPLVNCARALSPGSTPSGTMNLTSSGDTE